MMSTLWILEFLTPDYIYITVPFYAVNNQHVGQSVDLWLQIMQVDPKQPFSLVCRPLGAWIGGHFFDGHREAKKR